MATFQQLFDIGQDFASFVRGGLASEQAAVDALVSKVGQPGTISAATLQRIDALTGRYHLLIAGEMWCPDCHVNITALQYLCKAQPRVSLSIITKGRAEDDLKKRLGLEKVSIPLVMVLNEQFEPLGLFIEQPRVVVEQWSEQTKADYRQGHYMEATLNEVLALMAAGEK
ncbi:thioredoxin family protein [Pokkaliibacter sp. MBI-7]|uniref:thioredoxin family protein n=1 Tax=Pokkaliibacter sp. MBI-7 TaxID=3040600 RepID=UPI00244B9E3E|nr:thioredoxin family protein [Pokkaliibacter sp. MBI-7]MDH2435439.1 thioredoxin family protein [Pokkaliibacter sp. MBI-7]